MEIDKTKRMFFEFVCVRRRIKINKKGSRLTLKSENGIDGLSFRSASDGDAQSERSTPSPHSNR